MRLFLAIPASGETKTRLTEAIARWRPQMPEVKWEVPEALHLTLQFIGDWPGAREPELVGALEDMRWPPTTLRLAGTGFFPNLRDPRLLWVGVSTAPELARAVAVIAERLEPLGIAREDRPFTPHITVGRLPRRERAGAWKHTWISPAPVWGEIPAGGFGLYESRLQASPASRYRLRRWFG